MTRTPQKMMFTLRRWDGNRQTDIRIVAADIHEALQKAVADITRRPVGYLHRIELFGDNTHVL